MTQPSRADGRSSSFLADWRPLASAAWTSGLFHLILSLATVQGAVYFSQLIVARLLGPSAFGTVRVVEAALAILLIPAGLGMQTATVRFVALCRDESEQLGYLRLSFAAISVGSTVVALTALLVLPHLSLDPLALRYLRLLVWAVLFSNLGRAVVSYFQGRKAIRQVAYLSAASAVLGIGITVAGTAFHALPGWAAARIAAEVIAAATLSAVVWGGMWRARMPARIAPVLRFGAFAALSALVDRVATTADALYLDGLLHDSRAVGHYGVAFLVVTVASLLPAGVAAVALPYMAERVRLPDHGLGFTLALLKRLVAVTFVLAVVVMTVGPVVIKLALGSDFAPAGRMLIGLAPTLVIGAVMTLLGTYVLALGRPDLSLVQSVIGVGVNIGCNVLLIPRLGVWGAVWSSLATYVVRAGAIAFFMTLALRSFGRRA